ncbi:hypothetical protein CBL_13157 [Carabus blaptoides fortunei]
MNPTKKIKISQDELVEQITTSFKNIPIDKMIESHNSMLKNNTDIVNYIRNAENFTKKFKFNMRNNK